MHQTPGVISLLAGKPNALFPLTWVQFSAPRVDGTGAEEVELKVDFELAMGLQFALTNGIPPMVEWLTEFQELEHGRRRFEEGWMAVYALVNTGDPIPIEKPVHAYATAINGVIPMFETLLRETTEVETDANGIVSQSLRTVGLRPSPSLKSFIPFRLAVHHQTPNGCNPTAATTSLTRRQEVLDISREYNILILARRCHLLASTFLVKRGLLFLDDPYYFMYFGMRPCIPLYFTLEAQTGDCSVWRVPRFDSFSKIMLASASGLTGPTPLLDAMDRHTATGNLQASSFAQAVVVTLLRAGGCKDYVLAGLGTLHYSITEHTYIVCQWLISENKHLTYVFTFALTITVSVRDISICLHLP
ncbi:hypothetical protein EDB89DRAFT_2068555 [Lactarius sanguifluus]|nr:hypothetical protein EDB89DRAFT_2068555 [Lactarius sanguifluus]